MNWLHDHCLPWLAAVAMTALGVLATAVSGLAAKVIVFANAPEILTETSHAIPVGIVISLVAGSVTAAVLVIRFISRLEAKVDRAAELAHKNNVVVTRLLKKLTKAPCMRGADCGIDLLQEEDE